MYNLCMKLRALAHCMHYSGYIAEITHDSDFEIAMLDLASDYLHFESDRILSQLPSFCDTGYDKTSIFGHTFKDAKITI